MDSSTHPRMAAWQQKLLDLSRRNPLLSMRLSRGLQVVGPDAFEASQNLLDGRLHKLDQVALSETGIEVVLGRAEAVIPAASDTDPLAGLETAEGEIEASFTSEMATKSKKRIMRWTDLSDEDQSALGRLASARKVTMLLDAADDEELQDDLADMFRQARAKSEETGVHTLFLATGLVRWKDSENGTWADAPLFLIPVDLERANARTAFKLVVREEEIVLNPAMSYLFEKQHGVNWEDVRTALVGDGGRVDLLVAKKAAEEALAGLSKFAHITKEGRLTLLSYAKHRMWQDLRERANVILAHPTIERLLDPGTFREPRVAPEMDSIAWERLDQSHPPDELLLPLPADASQLRAIVRVDRGEDLVIQGPPGTGKSQTIANIIANSLGRGRRVLFVAEKMTALSVVHERLNDLGLGAFCLELHASKPDKAGVLRQMREALDARATPAVSGFDEAAARIQVKRLALNESIDALHMTYPNGLNLYRAIGLLASKRTAGPVEAGLTFLHVLTETASAHPARQEALKKYLIARRARPPAAKAFDVLRGVALESPAVFFERLQVWKSQRQALTRAAQATGPAAQWLLTTTPSHTAALVNLPACVVAWQALLEGLGFAGGMAAAALSEEANRIWKQFSAADAAYTDAWKPYKEEYQPSLWAGAGATARTQWDQAMVAWGPLKWWKRRELLKQLTLHRKHGTPPSLGELDTLMSGWHELTRMRQEAAGGAKALRKSLGVADGADLIVPRKVSAWAQHTLEILHDVPDATLRQMLLTQMQHELHSAGTQLVRSMAGGGFAAIAEALAGLADTARHISAPLQRALQALAWQAPDPMQVALEQLDAPIEQWWAAQPAFMAWESAERLNTQAQELGLGPLVNQVVDGALPAEHAEGALEKAWLTAFSQQVLMQHPEFTAWQGHARESAIAEFVLEDIAFETLTRKHLAALVAQRLRSADLDHAPGMALLKRELAKQRQHLPPRRLLRELAAIVPILKPCLLMSPMTVAEVLGPDTPLFDLVIFDEASQIPVADAVGAISHAKQVIIVGDPKQMPPSRGFASQVDDEEDDDEMTPKDLESILDESMATMDGVLLNWHYRSRHEDLIAFSNHRYYKGELITFPSTELARGGEVPSKATGMGLVVHDVGGRYERGTAQTNLQEAQAVVTAMRDHLLNNAHQESLGVITFNQRQQRLIERLWDKELRTHPSLELLAGKLEQEIFVKNLENVQGDERDVIYFSTTFGFDAGGRFLMNFGPLNQLGGERRLNVAITRARRRLEIFTSFKPEDMDVTAMKHRGAIDLRDYLTFARGGEEALAQVASPSVGLPDSPFEIAVAQALRERGWKVHEQVGCSGYKIDLAVVHPQHPGKYLAGIECDGATYHSFKIARDRDRQRQRLLEGLGWRIERIWSTDWFSDPQREMDRIHVALRGAAGLPELVA